MTTAMAESMLSVGAVAIKFAISESLARRWADKLAGQNKLIVHRVGRCRLRLLDESGVETLRRELQRAGLLPKK